MRSIAILDSMSRHATGISFILMMHHKGNDYSYHPRFGQPCQGGETRKYSKTHTDCTQPHNSKPSDLHYPFPLGNPSAISFPLRGIDCASKDNEAFFSAMFSDKSPWVKGFGSFQNVHILRDDKKLPYGVIIGVKHLNVDPTVMINAIQMLRNSYGESFNKLVAAGLSDNEALAVLMLNGNQLGPSINKTQEYYFCPVFSARRFFGQKPNDLSGGYYSDRTDYNRTYVQDVFLADPEDNGIKWKEAMCAELGIKASPNDWVPPQAPSFEAFVAAAKSVLAKALENEGLLTNKPYVYRDAQGNTHKLEEVPSAGVEDDEEEGYNDDEPFLDIEDEQEAA